MKLLFNHPFSKAIYFYFTSVCSKFTFVVRERFLCCFHYTSLLGKCNILYTSRIKVLLLLYCILVWTYFSYALKTYEVLLIYFVRYCRFTSLLGECNILYTSRIESLLSVYYILVWTYFSHTLETSEYTFNLLRLWSCCSTTPS